MRLVNPIHPGEKLLDDFLLPRGVSQRAFAAALGWPPRKLNDLIIGKRSITVETALQLAYTLGTSTELWMYLQISWLLHLAAQRKRELARPAETAAPSVHEG